jgi:hypothetical protein
VASLACLLVISVGRPASSQEANTVRKTIKPAPAEQAGWKLAFSDDFDRNELGEDWLVVDGKWTVEHSCLRGSGTLISARGFPKDSPPGFQRLEFEAATDVQPIIFFKDKPKPKVVVSDLSSFIHARPAEKAKSPLETGYFFQFGGMNNTRNQLRRAGATLLLDSNPKKLITTDQVHRIIVENDRGRLRMFVDDELVLQHSEKMSIVGPEHDRVGFYFYTAAKVDNVRVYVKQLPNDLDLD